MPRPGNVRGARKAAEDADRARRASNKAPQKKQVKKVVKKVVKKTVKQAEPTETGKEPARKTFYKKPATSKSE
tara:strand:- start:142 stop:360 length:219 start_codon:yes stop_codon:yes gene_type:complete